MMNSIDAMKDVEGDTRAHHPVCSAVRMVRLISVSGYRRGLPPQQRTRSLSVLLPPRLRATGMGLRNQRSMSNRTRAGFGAADNSPREQDFVSPYQPGAAQQVA